MSLLTLIAACLLTAPPPGLVWLEAEQVDRANWELQARGWGRSQFLSGDAWVQIGLEPGQVDEQLPAGGIELVYRFTTAAGRYEVWNRVGYEFVRSPFEWRLDDGEWRTTGPEALTTDLMELQEWNEVAWLRLGDAELTAGEHTLTIRLTKRAKADGTTDRILYASDLVCLYPGEFHPNGRHRPGEDPRTDADRAAAQRIYRLPAAAAGERSDISLAGPWEVCRHDENEPGEVATPMEGLPAEPHWRAIEVPGDKNQVPELIFAHRLWYRTRFEVPEALAGRSFYLDFPQNNLNTTVYVNGELCGFEKNPFCHFQIDVSSAVRPGVNELWIGIRDAWYGRATYPGDSLKLRRTFNLPIRYFTEGFQDLAYPIWNHAQSGILFSPTLVAAGPVYVADTFCRPSVADQAMRAEVTIRNPGPAVAGELRWEAVDQTTGEVARRFTPRPFQVAAGGETVLELDESWPDPELWWPDEGHLYRLRSSLIVGGEVVDRAEQRFGFREWSIDGKHFELNGLRWHGWADVHSEPTPELWLAHHRASNQRMTRFWGMSWRGMSPTEALDWFDEQGVVVRRSGLLDGQRIGYHAIEQDERLRADLGSVIKLQLMANWRDQMVAQVRGERNHPSVMIWSLENEWLYINCINLHRGELPEFEREVTLTSEAVRAVDPTRPTMVDGGGACRDNTLPVHGDHYVFEPRSLDYPALAYEPNPEAGGRGYWRWDEQRPRFLGEDYYANGINPADYALFGGEAAFLGKAQARPAAGLVFRMLTEGYRWAEYGAWHFWMGANEATDQYLSNAPRAAFCKQWDWTFAAGQAVPRTIGVFNDSFSAEPIRFVWVLYLGEKESARGESTHRIAPGHHETFDITVPMPQVPARTEAELLLKLSVGEAQAFAERKPVSILPAPAVAAGAVPVANRAASTLVYDPAGDLAPFLRGRLDYTRIESLEALTNDARVLIIGRDALDERESTSSRLAAWASAGRRVVVLEQRHPLHYQGVPADLTVTDNTGRLAYPEDLSHPALAGLAAKDFFTWGGDQVVYRRSYVKPSRGGKSLIQCGVRLGETALVEVPVGSGLMLLCQLTVGEKLAGNVVAQQLLANLIDRAGRYEQRFRPVQAVLGDDAMLPRVLDSVGLQYTRAEDPRRAIADPACLLAVVAATPAHLAALAGDLPALEGFYARGGYLVLLGLTPEGLGDYNRIVGFEHMIRPFRMERVQFALPKHPLCAGITTGDIVQLSGERIFDWTQDVFVEDDIFSYCVDYDEVAKFCAVPDAYFHNMTNGFVSADAWKYIFSFEAPGNTPPEFTWTLPAEQSLSRFEWIGNAFYHLVTRVELSADDGPPRSFDTAPNNEPQTFEIDPPLTGTRLHFRLAEWQRVPGRNDVVGVDNLQLWAARPAAFYQQVKPLLNVGGLMHYPRGGGGVLLCNLKWLETEAVPINAQKKRNILAALLHNLDAPFSGGATVIAGADLGYQPVDLSAQCNQFRGERGWFGDRNFTFADLPTGDQRFAGVPFNVYEFAASPVPNCIMLGGRSVPGNLPAAVDGIPVGRRVDALFFLHAARIDRRTDQRELREGVSWEIARYTVRYADGQTVEVPVLGERDVEHYRQESPRAVPGAQLGWVKPYDGTNESAVAYVMTWTNPRPEVAIESLGLAAPDEPRGVLALLAVTGATAR